MDYLLAWNRKHIADAQIWVVPQRKTPGHCKSRANCQALMWTTSVTTTTVNSTAASGSRFVNSQADSANAMSIVRWVGKWD